MADPTLIELAERCEAAREGSQFLDDLLARALGWTNIRETLGGYTGCQPESCIRQRIPKWSRSLDAAMSLVPEGEAWSVVYRANESAACIGLPCKAATPALALTAACLRARAEQAREP